MPSTFSKLPNPGKLFSFSIIFIFITFLANSQTTDQPVRERLMSHVKVLASDSLQGRGLGTSGAEKARQYIISQFKQANIEPLEAFNGSFLQDFRFRQGQAWIPAWNIVGVVEGSDPVLKDEFILIGAHYDHLGYRKNNGEKTIFPGADDNASGVSAIIELGRYFAENHGHSKRSLLFVAFDAEESGLLGARHFVENSPVPLASIKAMFSFDMVGMLEANRGLHLTGLRTLSNAAELVKSIAETHDITIRRTGTRIERRTDTAPFGDIGIPAIHVFTGTKSPYHKPEDTYDLLDYEGMVSIHHFMISFFSQLSTQPTVEPTSAFARASRSDRHILTGISAGLITHTGIGFHRFEEEFYRANSLFSTSAGVFVQLPFGRSLTLQPEVLFDWNGSKAEAGNFRRYSITIPLNIQIGTPRSSANFVRLYVFGGPYYRYNIGGSVGGEALDFSIYNQQEWGYNFGFGMQAMSIHIAFTLRRALDGIFNDDTIKQLDSGNFFTLGYGF